ncbi:MAG: glycosyltransferase family 9 protein [Candidatus Omnitrophica bacterium]|nr:glycosyltransferase family 9 protein [Candidatus Omnitrophota bacterium]
MEIEKDLVKNILVVRNDRFGEFLLNIPAFRALKETFKFAKLSAVVDPSVKDLAESLPYFDEVIPWGMQKHSAWEKISLLNLISGKKFDLSVILNPSKGFNLITYLARIPVRVGYDRKCAFLLTHKIADKKSLAVKHEVEYNLELIGLIGARTDNKVLDLKINENIIRQVKEKFALQDLDDLVVLHPWASDPIKLWPKESFLQLAKMLIEQLNLHVLIVGGRENAGQAKEVFNLKASTFFDLTGKTSLKELAVLLSQSKLLVSADSGPVHLACAVGTPVIALFRNDIPGKTAKRWGPWGGTNIVIEKNNLTDISVAEVFHQVREIMKR